MARTPPPHDAEPSRRRLGVVLVDPLPVVRAGVSLLIDDGPDTEVLAAAGSVDEALETVARLRRAHVMVLVGLTASGTHDAFWLIRTLRERFPGHVILGLGANAEPAAISRALFVGADGYVDKNVDPTAFLAAIQDAAAGRTVLATLPEVGLGAIVSGLERSRDIDLRLTDREREVLEVAAEGLTARQIGERLGVRERTVTTHLARIYGKLGVNTRLGAIRIAARSGLAPVGIGD